MRRFLAGLVLISLAAPTLAGGREPPILRGDFPICPTAAAPLPCLSLDARPIGRSVKIEMLPLEPREEGPVFNPPAHLRVTFPSSGQSPRALLYADELGEQLRVYPVVGLLRQYPEKGPYSVRAVIGQLRDLVRKRSNLRASPRGLPFLPWVNAAQAVRGAEAYLTFPGGAGIRYLTIYRQDFYPFLRGEVLYTFQGLTNDGKYYVSFTFPVAPKFLPARQQDYPPALQNWFKVTPDAAAERAYEAGVIRGFDALTNALDLKHLDAVVRSLRLQ